jgi:hypothetical protein
MASRLNRREGINLRFLQVRGHAKSLRHNFSAAQNTHAIAKFHAVGRVGELLCCLSVFVLATLDKRQKMADAERHEGEGHIPLSWLWEYGKELRSLSSEQILHICLCDDCLSVLGLCRSLKTITQVERRLKDAA